MGETELKKALQREGEERARRFWSDAEAAVTKKRREMETCLEQLQTDTEQKLRADYEELRSNLLFAAHADSRKRRLLAESALEERLLSLAAQILTELAEDNREVLWPALCAELPGTTWASCRIHPGDRAHAEASFPEAEILEDGSICGGMVVSNSDGTIQVDNSLPTRMLRGWPDLLPELIATLRKEVDTV